MVFERFRRKEPEWRRFTKEMAKKSGVEEITVMRMLNGIANEKTSLNDAMNHIEEFHKTAKEVGIDTASAMRKVLAVNAKTAMPITHSSAAVLEAMRMYKELKTRNIDVDPHAIIKAFVDKYHAEVFADPSTKTLADLKDVKRRAEAFRKVWMERYIKQLRR